MSKYVIELRPDCKVVQQICESNGQVCIGARSIQYLEELTADYINEHFSDLQDTAYQRGLEEGKKAFDLLDAERDSEYQRGLDDAWEAARKLFSSMADSDIDKAFPIEWNNGGFNALMNLQPQEAIAKLKAYEEKKADDKIEVGDTVNLKDGNRDNDGIVTKSWDNDRYFIMWADGAGGVWDKEYIVKTGRHFDIAKILEEMKE